MKFWLRPRIRQWCESIALVVALAATVGCASRVSPAAAPSPTLVPAEVPSTPILKGASLPAVAGSEVPGSVEKVPRVTPEELAGWQKSGRKTVVVDSRSRQSYDELHIAGAISIPYEDLPARYRELPQGVDIVFYCT